MINLSSLPKFAGIAAALATVFVSVPKSQAATITVLDFEGIVTNASGSANINDFYNGGTSSDGTSGSNLGVTFSSNALALCLNTSTEFCSNTSRGGQGNPNSQRGGLYYTDGAETFLNYASGFDTGFSFFYSAPFTPAVVNVYDGINGGNLLASLNLATTNNGIVSGCDGFSANYCPFVASGIAFTGIAKSIGFVGTNQSVFDDITFGSVIPDPDPVSIPEPFTIIGTLVGGSAALRMRKKLKATTKA